MKPAKPQHGYRLIRNIYLYLVALVGLVVFIIGSVGIINLVFKNYVFRVADYVYESAAPGLKGPCNIPYPDSYPQSSDIKARPLIMPSEEEVKLCKQGMLEQQRLQQQNQIGRDFSIAIAQILIGLPLWLIHWRIIQKEYHKNVAASR